MNFRERLNELMEEARALGVDQKTVADTAGISRSALNNYLSGRAKPKADAAIKLASYFKVTLSELGYLPETSPSDFQPLSSRETPTVRKSESGVDPALLKEWKDKAEAAEAELTRLKRGMRELLGDVSSDPAGDALKQIAALAAGKPPASSHNKPETRTRRAGPTRKTSPAPSGTSPGSSG